ncbi:hypothetical protein PTI98_012751 [Pleurotus ostreatus]|nr:hypothetical protein PTI98_012751 [Pleurotus ostreatus]
MGRTLTFLSLHPTLTEDTVQVHINIYSLHPTLTEDTVQFQQLYKRAELKVRFLYVIEKAKAKGRASLIHYGV